MKILVMAPAENILSQFLQQSHDTKLVRQMQEIIPVFNTFKPNVMIFDRTMDAIHSLKQIYLAEEFQKTVYVYLSDSIHDPQLTTVIDAGFDDFFIQTEDALALQIFMKRLQHLSDLKKQLYLHETHDALTEVGNPTELANRLLKTIEESDQTYLPFALLYIDLGHFKIINDHLGHLLGDALLKEVALRLKNCLRCNDYIARAGGDEFVIILKDIENARAVDFVVQKILAAMAKSYTLNKMEVIVKLSIGIALYPADGMDAVTLLQNADIAMYHAKKMGQNFYQFHSAEQQLQFKNKINLENDLNFALDNKELFLMYQPIYHLKEKEIAGMEVLLRWQHQTKGLIMPEVFIPIAENGDVIFQISEWVLTEICRQVREWELEQIKNFKISFNVSASLLLKKNLTKSILTIIQKFDLPIELFDAEITETVLLSNSSLTESVIHELKEFGLTFSIDDFGTGYSSFVHLKLLPLRAIKIDKSFIKNIITNEKDTIIVDSIIEIGRRMNIDVVAEGIETQEQLDFLLNKNCKKGQGYLLCPPLNAEKMSILLKNSVLK